MTDQEKIEKAVAERRNKFDRNDNPRVFSEWSFRDALAWRDQNPKPPAEDDAKLRDELAEQEALNYPGRCDLRDRFKRGYDAARAQSDARVQGLYKAAKTIAVYLEELKLAGYGIGAPDSLVEALRAYEEGRNGG